MKSLVLAVALLAAAPAHACLCPQFPPETVDEAMSSSDIVFRGRVLRADHQSDGVIYTIKVTRVWKGKLHRGSQVRVLSDDSSCGVSLLVNHAYDLAPGRIGDRLMIGKCNLVAQAD